MNSIKTAIGCKRAFDAVDWLLGQIGSAEKCGSEKEQAYSN